MGSVGLMVLTDHERSGSFEQLVPCILVEPQGAQSVSGISAAATWL